MTNDTIDHPTKDITTYFLRSREGFCFGTVSVGADAHEREYTRHALLESPPNIVPFVKPGDGETSGYLLKMVQRHCQWATNLRQMSNGETWLDYNNQDEVDDLLAALEHPWAWMEPQVFQHGTMSLRSMAEQCWSPYLWVVVKGDATLLPHPHIVWDRINPHVWTIAVERYERQPHCFVEWDVAYMLVPRKLAAAAEHSDPVIPDCDEVMWHSYVPEMEASYRARMASFKKSLT